MLVVHALFGNDDGELIFWAEADEASAWRPTLPDGPDGGVPLHPFGTAPATLRRALEGGELGIQPLTVGTATVLLPSDADGPRASGEPAAAVATAAWRVGGLRVPVGPAVRWLATVASAETESTPVESRMLAMAGGVSSLGSEGTTAVAEQLELALGADVRYWARAAAFALELLTDEQVVPELVRRADGDYAAVWRPLLTGQAERRRFRALAEAMPAACRALGKPGEPVPATELLRDFLGSAIDSLARGWLAESVWPEARWLLREGTGMPAAAGRWLEALGAPRASSARLSARRSSELAREVAAWTEAVVGASAPFRLCLRLTPPAGAPVRSVPSTVTPADVVGAAHVGVPAAAGAAAPGRVSSPSAMSTAGTSKEPIHAFGTTSDAETGSGKGVWRLEYLLQAADDPSVLVPAATVWRTEGAVSRLAGRRVVEPQALLLADLARAAATFGPIKESLEQPAPTGTELTVNQAYDFLRGAVPGLSELGLGVLTPVWWTRRGARRRLGVRVRLTPASDTPGQGVFGLQSLVDYDWRLALGDEELSPDEFARLVSATTPLVQLRGEWVDLGPDQLAQALRYWGGLGGAMSVAQAVQLAAGETSHGLPVDKVETTGWLADALEGEHQLEELPEPKGFVGELRPYQRRGFAWLTFMRRHGLGALLADDMGLGKTVQTAALLLHAGGDPALIVCPTSVLGNWLRELKRFAPTLRVYTHHGPARVEEDAFGQVAAEHDVVLTTYALVHRDEARLAAVPWAGLVMDEAQNVKNAAARTSRAVRRIKAGYRVALTGTPVENRLGELWSVMEALNPGLLGSAEGFRRRFALPIERDGDSDRAEELRRLVGPFILRRLKTDPAIVRDLPDKIEMKAYLPLTREQASLYEAVVQEMLARIGAAEGVERRGLVLLALTRLKQVCNHPAHYLGDGSPLLDRSGKLTRLEEMLEEAIAEGDHTLVFTQFAEWGGRLRTHLAERLGREVLYLHGGTPAEERDRLVARFQSADGPPVFVLSLRAGGVGLNLTRANRVAHYDRWWNPAVEAQATDRAFRIGQRRNVHVHTFVCAGTLEERIDELIESKRALAEAVIGTGESWLTELSTEDLRSVLTLRQAVIVDA